MSEIRVYQRSRNQILQMIDQLRSLFKFAVYSDTPSNVEELTAKIEKLEKTLKDIDFRLAKMIVEEHQKAA